MPLRAAHRTPLRPPAVAPFTRRRDPLEVPYKKQRHHGWCWAACVLMGRLYFEVPGTRSMRVIAGTGLPCDHCEEDAPPDNCKKGIPPQRILPVWECFGIDAEEVAGLDETKLRCIVEDEGKPVQVFYRRNHVVLVVGTWRDDDGSTGFLVHDPLPRSLGVGGKNLEREWGALRGLQGERARADYWINGRRGTP